MLSLFASRTRSVEDEPSEIGRRNQIKFDRLLSSVNKMVEAHSLHGLDTSGRAKLRAYWTTLVSLYVPGNEERETRMRFLMEFAKKEGCLDSSIVNEHHKTNSNIPKTDPPSSSAASSPASKRTKAATVIFGDRKGHAGFSAHERGISDAADHRIQHRLNRRLRQQLFALRKQQDSGDDTASYFSSNHDETEQVRDFGGVEGKYARRRQPIDAHAQLFAGFDMKKVSGSEIGEADETIAQETLTQEITDMASSLKENVLRMRAVINTDKQVLDNVDNLIESHIPKVQRQTSRLEEHIRNSGTLATYSMFFIVIVLFAYTYVVIRLTPRSY